MGKPASARGKGLYSVISQPFDVSVRERYHRGNSLSATRKELPMSAPQSFLDNLENLRLVTSVALEHVQNNRDEFVKCATGIQVRQAEKAMCKVRVLIVQLEKEFTILEYLVADGQPAVVAPPSMQNQNHAEEDRPPL
jgi:hypothetical protein